MDEHIVSYVDVIAHAEGIDETIAAFEELSGKFDETSKSSVSLENKFAALERRFQTTSAQASQFQKIQNTVNAAVAQNPELQSRANDVLAAAEARYVSSGVAVKALSAAHGGLDAQGQAALHSIRSFGEQIALGIPPTQALTGQLNHLTFAASGEGGLAGAFGQVGSLLGKFVTPLTATIGIVGGAAAAALYLGNSWQNASGEVDRALTGIGQRTGTTSADIANFTKANASATGLSVSQARDVALEFTKTGNVAVAGLKGVGDAIQGYALLTGKDAAEATKTFASAISGDLVKGLQEIDQRYGALDSSTTEYIRTLADQGNKTQALQVYIDAIAPANQRAEASVSSLTKAWQGFKNVVSNITSAPVTNTPQDTLNNAKTRQDEAVSNPSPIGRNAQGELVQFDSYEAKVKAFEEEVAKAQKAATEFNAGNIPAALRSISTAGDEVVKSIIPQIDQIDKLQAALNKLNDARNTPGVSRSLGQDDAAATAIQNQIAGLQEAQGQAERYNERVADISTQWGDVGQSTAQALQAAQNQLPVLQAVGGAARMAAQEVADYKTYMDQGKTATEAAALAASNLAARQAQVNSAAQETLASLRDQAGVASASNPLQAAAAQAQATYNGLLRQGVDIQTASAVAAQQQSNANAQIYESAEKIVNASKDQLDLTRAQGTEYEKIVKAQIAYSNAVDAGANSDQASAVYSNVLATETIKAERAAEQLAAQATLVADEYERAARAAHDAQFTDITPGGDNSFGFFQTKDGIEGNTAYAIGNLGALINAQMIALASGDFKSMYANLNLVSPYDSSILSTQSLQDRAKRDQNERDALALQGTDYGKIVNSAYSAGGIDAAIRAAQTSASLDSNAFQTVDQLYQFKNSGTTDKTAQASNLKDELAWLTTQPTTLARDTAIANLNQSIKQLTDSTDSLNSTNQAALSPYYDQDPRKTHIGFRSQGMATGGEITVPGGYSANDNMLAQIPVASGEIVSVRRPGQNLNGGNQQINMGGIHVTVTGNASKEDANAIGRTVYQAAQTAARQLAMAGR